jgi:hypothetical protein
MDTTSSWVNTAVTFLIIAAGWAVVILLYVRWRRRK